MFFQGVARPVILKAFGKVKPIKLLQKKPRYQAVFKSPKSHGMRPKIFFFNWKNSRVPCTSLEVAIFDEVIATIKAAAIKNKERNKDFHDAGLPSPPDPVITRWAT